MKHQSVRRDSGSALILVIVLIVLISAGMASVSFLTQSASSGIRQNAQDAALRTDLVSNAVAQAVQDLNFRDGGYVKWGHKDQPNRCEDGFPDTGRGLGYMGEYTSSSASGWAVRVWCKESPDSGTTAALASLILTGTGCTSPETSSLRTCDVGVAAGLHLYLRGGGSGSTCGSASDARAEFGSGIVNASGVWVGAGCASVALPSDAKMESPSDVSCAGFTKTSNAAPDITCGCPSFGTGSWWVLGSTTTVGLPACQDMIRPLTRDQIDPSKPGSSTRSLVDSQLSLLETPTSNVRTTPSGACPIVLQDGGLIDAPAWTAIRALAPSCSTLVFRSGVYRLDNVAISGFSTIVAGSPMTNAAGKTVCNPGTFEDANGNPLATGDIVAPPEGVQIQLSGTSSIRVPNAGIATFCAKDPQNPKNRMYPAIVAPAAGSVAPFAISDEQSGGPIVLTYDGGNAGSPNTLEARYCERAAAQGLCVYGYVLAPGGSAKINLNGDTNVSFRVGAMFRAVWIEGTGSIRYSGSVEKPPPFTGDRIVQFRLRGVELSTGRTRDLGTVQLGLFDYYGRRQASGVNFFTWRTMW